MLGLNFIMRTRRSRETLCFQDAERLRAKRKVPRLVRFSPAKNGPARDDSSFYLPNSKIASITIRYSLPQTAFEQAVLEALQRLRIEGVTKVNAQRLKREIA